MKGEREKETNKETDRSKKKAKERNKKRPNKLNRNELALACRANMCALTIRLYSLQAMFKRTFRAKGSPGKSGCCPRRFCRGGVLLSEFETSPLQVI